jgi:hypothetical protein
VAKRFAIWAAIASVIILVLHGIAIAIGVANLNFSTGNNTGF